MLNRNIKRYENIKNNLVNSNKFRVNDCRIKGIWQTCGGGTGPPQLRLKRIVFVLRRETRDSRQNQRGERGATAISGAPLVAKATRFSLIIIKI